MTRMSRDKREMEMGKIKLQALEMQLNAQRDMTAIQADLFRDMLHAMVNLRVDAISNGFALTMGLYADQARHYMSQQETITNAQISAKDPIERAGYHSRAVEIDLQLRRIRNDASKLYKEMTSAILLVGGSMPSLPAVARTSLMLS
jgi:hypothetical protein